MDKHFIFRNYWWIAILIGSTAVTVALRFGSEERVGLVGAAIAGTLGFFYFVQRQKLAETQLFHKLFTEFNARYDKLHGLLAAIPINEELSLEQKNVIINYFNLCAEEYLFYKQSYIPKIVWRSWCRGMMWYLNQLPFKNMWNEEQKTDSFYGLSLEIIREGAQSNRTQAKSQVN